MNSHVGGTSVRVSVLLGIGDGTSGPQQDFGTDGSLASVAIADVNADGRRDVGAANHDFNTAWILPNGGGLHPVGVEPGADARGSLGDVSGVPAGYPWSVNGSNTLFIPERTPSLAGAVARQAPRCVRSTGNMPRRRQPESTQQVVARLRSLGVQ